MFKALLPLLFFCGNMPLLAQTKVVYPYEMTPVEHPDYLRHHVKAPDMSVFDNKVQFIGLRTLDGKTYKEMLDLWVDKYKLGNILWPSYPLLFDKKVKDIVAEIKKRNLFLFDIWGYVPGSGPGGYWQQFQVPPGVLSLFKKELGNHWLGMDNGEQDGRYVGSFAPSAYPLGADRKQQYFNFQRHFQEMGELLGNKMATLVSLNFGHYFLKEGIYTLIGAETAQALPNSQVYYSFIRGAGKQYGVHWFGNASLYNRWGWKHYNKKNNAPGQSGPTKGASLSLLKRLMYSQLFYDCVAVGLEAGMLDEDYKLTPLGKLQQEAVKWSEKYKDPGTMYTPVAFMLDFFSGWSFPRHLYSSYAYRVWGNLPYEKSDYLTDNMLNLVYPGYQDASYYQDERGFIAPTPYGDIADCLLSDAPLWLLKQYPLLVIADNLGASVETKDKLEEYVRAGGHLIITSGSLKNMPGGLCGITAGASHIQNGVVGYQGRAIKENGDFVLTELQLPKTAKVVQRCGNVPAIAELNVEKGNIAVIASPFGVAESPQCKLPVVIQVEKNLDKPYPMLQHVEAYMKDVLASYALFETNPDFSLVTCVKSKDNYSVLVTNNGWEPRPLEIKSKIGDIVSIKEMKIDQSEINKIGYAPEIVKADWGKNTSRQIVGGGTRAFSIKIKQPNVEIAAKVPCVQNSTGRSLTLRNVRNLKEEILSRPTFFEHYDGVMLDWKYLDEKNEGTLAAEAGWLGRQKLNITVDLSSGLNLFPDLRLVNNDTQPYQKSVERIKMVIDKMEIIGAKELLITSHRFVENNFSYEQFRKSLIETFQMLSDYASTKGISLLFSNAVGRYAASFGDAANLVKDVSRPNFMFAPLAAIMLDHKANMDQNIEMLKKCGIKHLVWAVPERDLHNQFWNVNGQINRYKDQEAVEKLVKAFPGCKQIMDGLYNSWDDEYLDAKVMSSYMK